MEANNIKIEIGEWQIIYNDNTAIFSFREELREYNIPENVEKIEINDNSISFYYKDEYRYFKFEEGVLVGDLFNNEDEHIDTLACYEFEAWKECDY